MGDGMTRLRKAPNLFKSATEGEVRKRSSFVGFALIRSYKFFTGDEVLASYDPIGDVFV